MENKSLKYWKSFSIILIILNVALIAFLIITPMVSPPHRGPRENPGRFIIKKLEFSSQQEAEFNKLREAHHDSVEGLQFKLRKLKKSFFDGLKSESEFKNKDSILNKIAENQRQIDLVTFDHFEKVRKICNPKQKIIFNDIIQEVLERLGKPPIDSPR